MAGDWIPYTKELAHKLEVLQIAKETGRPRREVIAILLEFWAWADSETEDGQLRGIDGDILATLIVDTDATFWSSMCRVGWLQPSPDGLFIPNFHSWMGRSAKRRLRQNRSKQDSRSVSGADGKRWRQDGDKMATSRGPKMSPTEQNRTEQNSNGNILTDVCPETASPVSGPPLLTFPCAGKEKEWHLAGDHIDELKSAYPALDILAECRKALVWVNASPGNRKTAKGMKRFLASWMGRAQDRGAGRTQAPPKQETIEERLARLKEGQCRNQHGTPGPSTHPESSS